jgi:hypothetical protein
VALQDGIAASFFFLDPTAPTRTAAATTSHDIPYQDFYAEKDSEIT